MSCSHFLLALKLWQSCCWHLSPPVASQPNSFTSISNVHIQEVAVSGAAGFVVGVLVALALLELVLQLLPVERAYGAEPDAGWPAHHMVPNSQYTFSAGWALEYVRHGRVK